MTVSNIKSYENDEVYLPSKITCFFRKISIEPVIFFYLVSLTMQGALTTNLLHDKVCLIQYKFSDDECKDLSKNVAGEDEVQRSVSQLNMYLKLIQNIPSILFVLFLGAWSDKHGRKIPMILPLFGSFLGSLICLMNSYFWSLPPEHILMSVVPRAMTGGSTSLMMASYSYVSDKSDSISRTTRISFIDLMFTISSPVGFYLSDVLYSNLGYIGVYGIGSGIFIFNIAYVIIFIDDTRGPLARNLSSETKFQGNESGKVDEEKEVNPVSSKQFSFTYFRNGKNWWIILLLMINICLMNIIFGSISLDYLYVKKKFSWTYSQYIHLTSTQYILIGLCSSIVLPILSYQLQVEENFLGFLGCLSKVSGSLIQAFAFKPWHLYLASSTSCMEGIPLSVARSKISQLVHSSELGKTFSILACWECLAPLISNPLYTFTYDATLDAFPGAIYLISTSVHSLASLIFLFLLIRSGFEKRIREAQIEDYSNIDQKLIEGDDVNNA